MPLGWNGVSYSRQIYVTTDGDGKADPGIWRASQGIWIIPTSSSNYTQYIFSQWGQSGDIVFPNTTGKH
ncbi:MAG TPA: hypothetical protein VJ464_07245 [Blastocatellia bacterium]|nr:hypothetical protein [Blastocatellia bacterium]